MSASMLRGVKEIVIAFDMLHSRSQCAREVLRRLSSKKMKTPDITVKSEIRAGLHPTIKVSFIEGKTMEFDAAKHNASEIFQSIHDETVRSENWKQTVMFRPSLQKQGLI